MPQVQTVPIPLLNPSLEAILAPWCFVLSVLPSLHSTACKLNYLWKRCSIISKRPHIPNLFSNHYPNILAVKAFLLRTKAVRLHSQTVDIYSLLFKVFQPPEPFIPLVPGPVIPVTWHIWNHHFSDHTPSIQPPVCKFTHSPSVGSLFLGESLSQPITFLLAPLPSFPA